MTTFNELGVPTEVINSLESSGINSPFPIQAKTLPDSLSGKDVLGRGRTGSGKTVAFSVPMVARLAEAKAPARRKPSRPLGLVLAPTRELATQIDNTLAPLAKSLNMRTTVIYGGVPQARQEKALAAGVDIVIACPGRLDDLAKQGVINLDAVEVTVLDEADHMADLGFLPVVKRLLDRTPQRGQRLLFSATLDNGVDKIVNRYMHNPRSHSVDEPKAAVTTMEHHIFEVDDQNAKKRLIVELASGSGKRILFSRTKHHAKKLAKTLTSVGIPAVDLHGNLSQNARDRNLAEFSSGGVRVLVATDVAARGVHVDDVELVIHVDPPAEHKAYLHRSGRTARAGSSGAVVTICLPEQEQDVKRLMRAAGVKASIQKVTADSPAVTRLVGEVADKVDPRTRAALVAAKLPQQGGGSSTGANAQRKRARRSGNQRTEQSSQGSPRPRRQAGSGAGSNAGQGSQTPRQHSRANASGARRRSQGSGTR